MRRHDGAAGDEADEEDEEGDEDACEAGYGRLMRLLRSGAPARQTMCTCSISRIVRRVF